MEYETFTAQTVGEAVELINLFTGGEAREEELRRVLHLYALGDRPLDVDGFADLARRLRAVFESDDADERVRHLNELIAHYEPAPYIAEHDGQAPHFHFVPDDGPDLHRVGASLTMALAHLLVDLGGDRLGVCPAPRCGSVFVDHTRNRNQRFCSKTCATRVHVAEHRARR